MRTYNITYIEHYSDHYLVNANDKEEAKEALYEAICDGLCGPEECDGSAMEVVECSESLSDDEVDASAGKGFWNESFKISHECDIPDAIPNDLADNHYLIVSYDTYEDKIEVCNQIFTNRNLAVDKLQNIIVDALEELAGYSHREAVAALDSARHYPHEDSVCEYDNTTDMAKVYYSAAGDEIKTFQIVKL